jgi:hypothetical protein
MRGGIVAVLFGAAFVMSPIPSPLAQVCNSMTGSLNCAAPEGFLPGVGEGTGGGARRSGSLPGISTLGGDLMGGGDQPGTIGAITFGSGGRRCSGMFRSVNC